MSGMFLRRFEANLPEPFSWMRYNVNSIFKFRIIVRVVWFHIRLIEHGVVIISFRDCCYVWCHGEVSPSLPVVETCNSTTILQWRLLGHHLIREYKSQFRNRIRNWSGAKIKAQFTHDTIYCIQCSWIIKSASSDAGRKALQFHSFKI